MGVSIVDGDVEEGYWTRNSIATPFHSVLRKILLHPQSSCLHMNWVPHEPGRTCLFLLLLLHLPIRLYKALK